MQKSLVIVAGGLGSRMKSDIPKQFILILDKPVLVWTIERFMEYDKDMPIVLVLPEAHFDIWVSFQNKYPYLKKVKHIRGGQSRTESVIQGLSLISDEGVVGIHDAVRPLVSIDVIRRSYSEAIKSGSAIPVAESEDSLRIIEGEQSKIIDRDNIKRVQTPQVFSADRIKEAYAKIPKDRVFTDDASVFEYIYGSVKLVEGNRENVKLTYPGDVKLAEFYIGIGSEASSG